MKREYGRAPYRAFYSPRTHTWCVMERQGMRRLCLAASLSIAEKYFTTGSVEGVYDYE